MNLVLLTRQDCELCAQFQHELAHWAKGDSLLELRVQDVDADPDQRRRYGLRVPVLLLDGALVCATRFDAAALERLLRPRGPA